ncbi:RFX-like transcription factor daf-19 [Folsomia candida]|uniref:RFX-like transcription factor daf-19 n=1 Tax=Folsomia candida TaxID=158441 RepID=A0A226EVZ6_FOLCA|nr:RFX-like transcription factor daf-19 [Folsomia candida]
MDGGEEVPPTSPSSEDLNTSLLGRLRRVGSSWLGGGGAMVPPPAEDVNVSLLSTTVVRKRGRPPKTPTTPIAPNFPPESPSLGDEEPGPSTLDTSRLAVKAPRPPRKSVSPSNRADATADATNWLLERIRVSDNPALAILKSQLMDRYEEYCEGKGTEPLIDSLIGKEVKKCFPNVTTSRKGGRGNVQYTYGGITWVADALQQQQHSQQQQQHAARFRERLADLHALTKTVQEVTTTNSEEAWEALLLFPYHVLQVPRKSDKVVNLTKWVKDLAHRWGTDRQSTTPAPRVPRPPISTEQQQQQRAKKVEAKLSDGDVGGAIRLLTSDDVIAPNNEDTLSALLAKHPPHPEPANFPDPPNKVTPPAPIEDDQLLAAIVFISPRKGRRILKDLLSPTLGQGGEELIKATKALLGLMLRGDVPEEVCPIFYGASLTALLKKTGGIRPVAVGNVWRRLLAKIVVNRITPNLVEYLSPHQLGVGVKGGAEAGAHAARIFFNASHHTPQAFLKMDFTPIERRLFLKMDAFNEIRRDVLLNIIREKYPEYFPFIAQCHSPSTLFYGTTAIPSLRGCQQGDPLGPALFSLVVHPILQAINTTLNMWYLDDATVADSPAKVLEALATVVKMGEEVGLHLNTAKCEVGFMGATPLEEGELWAAFQRAAPGILPILPETATLLGSPLTDEAIVSVLGKKTEDLATMSSRLRDLTSHSAFYLLRASISTPRLIYFLRCAPSWTKKALLQEYDDTLKGALETTLNCHLSPDSWLQSSLPVKLGGLGVRHAVDTAMPCFIASCHSTSQLVSSLIPEDVITADTTLEEAEREWTTLAVGAEKPAETLLGSQSAWESPLQLLTTQKLHERATEPADKARLLAAIQPHAGAWLKTLPSPQLGTHLPNEAFRVATALRLGCDICVPHKCPCGDQVTAKGYHGLKCRKSAGRHSRHAAANDVIARALRSAEVPCIKEPPGCARADGKKPDGLTMVPWARGRSLVWDFTCADTFAPSHLLATSKRPGAAAETAHNAKNRKYAFLLDRFLFVPVAMETTGVWAKEGLHLIEAIGERIATTTGESRAKSFLIQRMSVAIQRGNVAAILGTLPPGKELEEVFNL